MTAYFIAVYVICIAYMILNFRYDIQMLQQNSYRIRRYYRWLEDGNFFSAWRLTDVALLFLLFSTLLNTVLASFVVAATLLVKIVVLLRRKYKNRSCSLAGYGAYILFPESFLSPWWRQPQ